VIESPNQSNVSKSINSGDHVTLDYSEQPAQLWCANKENLQGQLTMRIN
jgi:hypothetical protein